MKRIAFAPPQACSLPVRAVKSDPSWNRRVGYGARRRLLDADLTARLRQARGHLVGRRQPVRRHVDCGGHFATVRRQADRLLHRSDRQDEHDVISGGSSTLRRRPRPPRPVSTRCPIDSLRASGRFARSETQDGADDSFAAGSSIGWAKRPAAWRVVGLGEPSHANHPVPDARRPSPSQSRDGGTTKVWIGRSRRRSKTIGGQKRGHDPDGDGNHVAPDAMDRQQLIDPIHGSAANDGRPDRRQVINP